MVLAFRDRWILSNRDNRPVPSSVIGELQTDVRLDEWIDSTNGRWDAATVEAVVGTSQASSVLQIPLPVEPREDILRWPFTQDGRVTVKSAYHRIREKGRAETEPTVSAHAWTKIWSSNVWPKVKFFLWKFASNTVAVRSNLARRGVQVSPICLSCDEEETTEHAVTGCCWTREIQMTTLQH